ncbi:MAG: InlB B-repeat-containing protein [Bacteroidales bacterium]
MTNIIAEVDMSALQTEGLNYLYIRTKDSRGNWSHTNVIEFSIDKHITLFAEPLGGGTVSGEGWYEVDYELSVIATSNEGYQFDNWTEEGSIVHNEPTYTFIVTEHRTLTAQFSMIDYQLTLLVNPVGAGTTSGDGLYNMGDEIPIQANPETGWYFVNWTDNNGEEVTLEEGNFIMPAANVTLTANFAEIPTYSLSLIASPAEGGTVSGDGDYEEGTSVPVSATANEGYLFVNWTDNNGIVSESESFNYTMPAENITLTANFEEVPPPQFTVTLIANPDNIGAVITGGGDYEQGQTVNISASVVDGYNFTGWTGSADDVALLDNEHAMSTSFIMPDRNINLTANYEEIPPELFTLSLIASPSEGGTVSGEGDYEEGETVSISATANEGFEFSYWENTNSDIVSESAEFSFNMPAEDLTLLAVFDIINNLSDLDNVNILLYPNPVNDKFFVKSENTIKSLSLFDLNGQLIIEQGNINSTIAEVLTNNLDIGIYIIKIYFNDGEISRRISIMR